MFCIMLWKPLLALNYTSSGMTNITSNSVITNSRGPPKYVRYNRNRYNREAKKANIYHIRQILKKYVEETRKFF